MAVESRKKDRVFFSYREASAGTADTTCFFEGRGTMTFPEPEYQQESDKGKLGSGEHGTGTELQAVWTPWTYTCDRMSELCYFLSYFQGRTYTPTTVVALEQHQFLGLPVESRELPTFSFEYGLGGTGLNKVLSRAFVNEYSITLANGDNGVVEATFSGFANRHRISSNAIAANAAGNMSSGAFSFASEPLVNYKCTKLWKADTAQFVRGNSADFNGANLGANLVNLTALYDSLTMTGNNGMTISDMARAGGCGIINNNERGDREYTLEIAIRKDATNGLDSDALFIADTKMAIEVEFTGPYISGSDPYSIEWLYPVVMLTGGAPEDDGSPIVKTYVFEVFDDSNNEAMNAFAQSQVGTAYNAAV
jgi:hypothetical protein